MKTIIEQYPSIIHPFEAVAREIFILKQKPVKTGYIFIR